MNEIVADLWSMDGDRSLEGKSDTPTYSQRQFFREWCALLLVMLLLVALHHIWAIQMLLVVGFLWVPGRLLLASLRISVLEGPRVFMYSVCLSVVVLCMTGLIVDILGLLLGSGRPLTTDRLTICAFAVLAALVITVGVGPREYWLELSIPKLPYANAFLIILPAIVTVGAARLNHGFGGGVATAGELVILATLCAGALRRGLSLNSAATYLWVASLSAAWSFSQRGTFAYGFDISSEFHLAASTTSAGVWHLSHVGDAYGSMLSLTVLPATLHGLTGVTVLSLLKVVYPALLALVPVGVLLIARRIMSVRWAYVSSWLVIGQAVFFASMPAIARQEVGLLMFVVLIDVIFERRYSDVGRPLIFIVSFGLVVAHYSTAYLAIAVIGLSVLVAGLRALRVGRSAFSPRVLVAFIALVFGAALWYGAITRSTSNVTRVANQLEAHGLNILPNQGAGLFDRLLNGNVAADTSPAAYQSEVATSYAQSRPSLDTLPDASRPVFNLQLAPPVSPSSSSVVGHLFNSIVAIINETINLAAVIAVGSALLRRRVNGQVRQYAIVGSATVLFLFVVRVSGTFAVNYNQERAVIQAMIVLAGMVIWIAAGSAAPSKRFAPFHGPLARWIVRLTVPIAALTLLANSTGLLREVAGDQPANLSSHGEDTERFVQTAEDVAGARWLHRASFGSDGLIYGDRYGQLRWLTATGQTNGFLTDVTPQTLSASGWIYSYSANIIGSRARTITASGQAVIYKWPSSFLEDNYDRVYDSPTSKVYHG